MKILLEAGSAEIVEKNSRFIASLCSVETPEEAQAFIEQIKKKYWDAKHNCSAYVIGKDAQYTRCNDDGEPAQTAGLPMLEVLLHSEVRNIAVVVTRYFGGILLGTGGLVRAYQKAAKDTLDAAEKYLMVPGACFLVSCDYSNYQKLENLINEFSGSIENTAFEDNVKIYFSIAKSREEEFLATLKDRFFSALTAEKTGEKYTKQIIF